MAESSKPGTTKKYVSSACTLCRNRKVKCDGQLPACSYCIVHHQDCHYNHDDKRKVSRKKTFQSLSDRIALLEDLLRKHGIDVPPADLSEPPLPDPGNGHGSTSSYHEVVGTGNDDVVLSNADQPPFFPDSTQTMHFEGTDASLSWLDQIDDFQQDFAHADVSLPINSLHDNTLDRAQSIYHHVGDGQHAQIMPNVLSSIKTTPESFVPFETGSTPELDLGNKGQSTEEKFLTGSTRQPMESVPPNSTSSENTLSSDLKRARQGFDKTEDTSWTGESDEIIDQLSARMGSFQIAEDGQLRYFGATSNLHILHNGLSSLSRAPSRSVRHDGEDALCRAGLGKKISKNVERYLEDLYFRWEDPAIHVVDEEMYFCKQDDYYAGEDGSPFFSETLKNTICAAGAHLTSGSDLGLPQNATDFFGSRAKCLLEIEMDSPSVATVQALVILSAIEAASTRDARGWLYSGMAVRLSMDLGLHIDMSSNVQDGSLSIRDLDVRRTTFWGVFVHDHMWSLYVGRPWGINIQDISLSRPPKEKDALKSIMWTPCSDPIERVPEQDLLKLYDPVETCHDANVSLCLMMRQLSMTVYSDKTLSDHGLRDFATNMRVEFDTWLKSLPPELAVDLSDETKLYLPHVLQLHMQFYAISILLHRPFFSRSFRKLGSLNQRGSDHPRHICITAAQSVVKLLRIYRKQHTLRRTNVQIVHLVFTASLICLYNTYSNNGAMAQNSLQDLQFCCQALGEIGEAYQSSTRALEVIICIKREWLSKTRLSKRFKRPNAVPETEDTDHSPRKRRVTLDQATDQGFQGPSSTTVDNMERDIGMYQYDPWQFPYGTSESETSPDSLLDAMFATGSEFSMLNSGRAQFSDPFSYLNSMSTDISYTDQIPETSPDMFRLL